MILRTVSRLGGKLRASVVARGALTSFGARIFGAAVAYATQLYLARQLGAEELGIFAFAWTWLTVLAFLTPIGFDISVVRYVPQFVMEGAWGRVRGVIMLGRRSTLLVSLLAAALWCATVLALGEGFRYRTAMLLAPLALPIVSLVNLHEGIARGFHWVKQVAVPSFAVRPALLLLGCVVAVELAGYRLGPAIIVAAIIANLLTLGFQVFAYRRALPDAATAARPDIEARPWIRTSVPMMFIVSFELLLANTDIVMMGLMQGPAQTGVYNIAVRTASCLLFVFFAITSFAAPRIAELHAEGDRGKLLAFCRKVRLAMLAPTVLGAVALWIGGPSLLALFGKDFDGARTAITILSVAAVARAAAGPLDSLLTMTGQQVALAGALGSAALVNVAGNAILIPRYGSVGAAAATTISIGLEIVVISVLVGRRSGYWPLLPSFARPRHPVESSVPR